MTDGLLHEQDRSPSFFTDRKITSIISVARVKGIFKVNRPRTLLHSNSELFLESYAICNIYCSDISHPLMVRGGQDNLSRWFSILLYDEYASC